MPHYENKALTPYPTGCTHAQHTLMLPHTEMNHINKQKCHLGLHLPSTALTRYINWS
uniref:Uncharacterized protein n=1 Tax=Anguilla anguilla TaxID=7936 RepID=A0A0E9XHA0_ANGAN